MRNLHDFEGVWRLEKTIQNANGPDGAFAGEARWTRGVAGLEYLEEGELRLNGAPMKATRRYLWRAPLAVYFDDGRFFHDVPPEGGDTHHLCPPDRYNVHYDFGTWPFGFRVVWMVRGPAKAYQMTCLYAR